MISLSMLLNDPGMLYCDEPQKPYVFSDNKKGQAKVACPGKFFF